MTQTEALKQALEALELEDMACRYEKDPTPEHIAKAITAIKEALAQPQQEPVAYRQWVPETPKLKGHWMLANPDIKDRCLPQGKWEPLYTTPPQRTWQGLTDEDVMAIAFNFDLSSLSLVAKAIEAKLKEKNT
jgi:hypothetical protein